MWKGVFVAALEFPVIARIEDDHVVVDLRTVFEDQEPDLLHCCTGRRSA